MVVCQNKTNSKTTSRRVDNDGKAAPQYNGKSKAPTDNGAEKMSLVFETLGDKLLVEPNKYRE